MHLVDAVLQVLEQVVQVLHPLREVLAPALHELLEVRLATLGAVAQHLVQLLQHLAHGRHVLWSHGLHALLHALEIRLHHLLLQHLQQLLELLPRLRIHEVVLV